MLWRVRDLEFQLLFFVFYWRHCFFSFSRSAGRNLLRCDSNRHAERIEQRAMAVFREQRLVTDLRAREAVAVDGVLRRSVRIAREHQLFAFYDERLAHVDRL